MDAAVVQPLIRDGGHDDLDSEEEELAGQPLQESSLLGATTFVWTLTLVAGISGLLLGFDTGVVSSMLVSIHDALSQRALTILDKSLITSATSFFALIASPLCGLLADLLGRKKVIVIASSLFVVGALLQACAVTVSTMIAGRSIVGLAVGGASAIVPMYIAELAPSSYRGRLVMVLCLLITGGQVVAYIVGWAFSTVDQGWRWMVGLGALPALVQLAMLPLMPETPRWLVKKRRETEAEVVLSKVYGVRPVTRVVEELAASVLLKIRQEHREEEAAAEALDDDQESKGLKRRSFRAVKAFNNLMSVGRNRRALVIACALQGLQQLCGFNSLMYFSATVFGLVGFASPTLTSLTIAVTNFIFTLVAYNAIDRIGRRRILLCSTPFMVLALTICAVAFRHIDISWSATSDHTTSTKSAEPSGWSVVLLASLILYVAAYAVGLGNVPWQQSELFPLGVRSVGSGLATMTNWSSNTLIGLSFLPMMEVLTPTWTFVVYAAVCAVAWLIVFCIYPETAGLGLEEVSVLLKDGWGVNEGHKRWEARKADCNDTQASF